MIQLLYATNYVIYPDDEFLGINRIYAHLKDKGLKCKITELHYNEVIEEAYKKIDLSCNYFGFSIFNDSARFVFKISEFIKKNKPEAIIFYGSPFATNSYELLFNDCPNVDFITLGHSERVLEEIFKTGIEKQNINKLLGGHKNIVTRNNMSGKEPCYINIDELVFPSREILKNKKSFVANLVTKHGCAGNCSFCSIKDKKSIRKHESIFHEIISIYEKTNIRCFNFTDASIEDYGQVGKENLRQLCKSLIEYPVKFSFRCYIRADSFRDIESDISLLLDMKKAGFNNIFIGIESANDQDLKIFNKRATVEDNYNITNIMRKVGVDPKFGFIMIYPYSTKESLRNNYKFLSTQKTANITHYTNTMEIYYNSPMYWKIKRENQLLDSYCYIDKLCEYKIVDPFVKQAINFLNESILNNEMRLAYFKYMNYDYLLSYFKPFLGEDLNYYLELKNELDEIISKILSEFFYIIYEENDLKKAFELYAEFNDNIINQYNKVGTLTNKLLRAYVRSII